MSDQSIMSSDMDIMNKYCKYINKKVELKTIKSSHTGCLKCIDPMTQTIALIVKDLDTNTSKVVIAMSHSIRSIELVDDNSDDNNDSTMDLNRLLSTSMAEDNDRTFTDEELTERKRNVINWLLKNRIPCVESDDGSLCIAYAVTLMAPYGRQECVCDNEMVLHQIQTLLDSLPQNQ